MAGSGSRSSLPWLRSLPKWWLVLERRISHEDAESRVSFARAHRLPRPPCLHRSSHRLRTSLGRNATPPRLAPGLLTQRRRLKLVLAGRTCDAHDGDLIRASLYRSSPKGATLSPPRLPTQHQPGDHRATHSDPSRNPQPLGPASECRQSQIHDIRVPSH